MCGIALVIEEITMRNASLGRFFEDLEEDIKEKLVLRGPDHFQTVERTISNENGQLFRVIFNCAVLHLRGQQVYKQPAIDENQNILCWNGEIFGGTPEIIPENQNDTQYLLGLLQKVSHMNDAEKEIVNIFQKIEGPFSFLWYHASVKKIYFGHDRFGRRSLLCHHHVGNDNGSDKGNASGMHSIFASFTSLNDGAFHQSIPFVCDSDVFCLSSVAVGNTSTFEEVPCIGIYCIDLSGQQLQFFPYLPLQALTEIEPSSLVDKYGCLHSLTFCDEICQDDRVNGAADLLLQHLSNAVGNRVRTIPKRFLTDLSSPTSLTARVGVLFSGGLDSVVLGALTHFHLPPDESVDLLNVCFDADRNFKSPDRLAAEISWKELKKLFPTREWRFIRINIHFEEVLQYKNDIYDLMQPCDTHMDFNIGAAFWFLSRAIGVITPSTSSGNNLNANDLNAFLKTPQKRVEEEKLSSLKLFDGLKDTTTNDPTQNLCPVINCKRKKKGSCLFRICRVCCFRIQHYVNKLLNEQTDEREKESCKKNFKTMGLEESVDDVIAIFHLPDSSCDCKTHRTKESKEAASALQNSNAHSNSSSSNIDEQNVVEYATDARVLLVGIGADEQLAGYGRHRTAYLKGGKKALEEELAMDMNRIWKRNLGRDDRCISAHGREARFPYLDENVVKYLKSIPVETICDLDQERGDGDKLILRVAARRLGLYNCTVLAKRAIQFGSRIAKHSNVLSFGSNRQASGDAKFTLTTEKRF